MASNANPYIIAIIAVTGTLLGALVTATTQAMLSKRQRKWIIADEMHRAFHLWLAQAQEDRGRLLWSARRDVYVRFLACLNQCCDVASRVGAVVAHHEARGKTVEETFDQESEEQINAVSAELTMLHGEVILVASRDIAELATEAHGAALDELRYAIRTEGVSRPDMAAVRGRLIQAMRHSMTDKFVDAITGPVR